MDSAPPIMHGLSSEEVHVTIKTHIRKMAGVRNPRIGFQRNTNFIQKLERIRREISPSRVFPSQESLLYSQLFTMINDTLSNSQKLTI